VATTPILDDQYDMPIRLDAAAEDYASCAAVMDGWSWRTELAARRQQ
jgi:hypothetical protein